MEGIFCFLQSSKAASGGIGKISILVIAIADIIFAAGILLNDDPFLIGQIPGHDGSIFCFLFRKLTLNGFRICYDLLDERIITQCFRVYHFPANDTTLCQFFTNFCRVNIIEIVLWADKILLLCMGNHLIKFQIGKVLVQLLQILTFHLMNGFTVHPVYQPKSCQVCMNLNGMLTVRGCTHGKIHMG